MPPSLPSRPSKDVDRIAASWLCKLLDCVAYAMSHPQGDGRTILNESSGTLRALRQPGGGTDGGGTPFTLFEVVKDTDTSIKINGYNSAEDRYTNNYVIFGLSRVELADAVQVSVTGTGVIYLEITCPAGGSLTVIAGFAAALPEQDSLHIYWHLATVLWANDKISSIQQPPTGIINIPSRAG